MHYTPDGSKYVATLGATTEEFAGSATVAAAANNNSIPAVANKRNFLRGFSVTGSGATAASVIEVTITGLNVGTLRFSIAIPAGATLGVTPLMLDLNVPLAASADNTAITINVPTFGAGNTNSSVVIWGFRI